MLQVDRFAVQGSNMVVLVQSIIRGTAPPLPEDGLRDVLRAALQEEQKQYLQISAVLKQMIIVQNQFRRIQITERQTIRPIHIEIICTCLVLLSR